MQKPYYSYARNYFKHRNIEPVYKSKGYKQKIKNLSNEKNSCLPPSEQWFQLLWRQHKMHLLHKAIRDKENYPFGGYIPDIINTYFCYVIEIDGITHNSPLQQEIDKMKDDFYNSRGYKCFRIKAYDITNFNQVLEEIKKIRSSKNYEKQFPSRTEEEFNKIFEKKSESFL